MQKYLNSKAAMFIYGVIIAVIIVLLFLYFNKPKSINVASARTDHYIESPIEKINNQLSIANSILASETAKFKGLNLELEKTDSLLKVKTDKLAAINGNINNFDKNKQKDLDEINNLNIEKTNLENEIKALKIKRDSYDATQSLTNYKKAIAKYEIAINKDKQAIIDANNAKIESAKNINNSISDINKANEKIKNSDSDVAKVNKVAIDNAQKKIKDAENAVKEANEQVKKAEAEATKAKQQASDVISKLNSYKSSYEYEYNEVLKANNFVTSVANNLNEYTTNARPTVTELQNILNKGQ